MENIKVEVKGDILTLTVNLKEEHGQSKSGKTTIIATSGGNAQVPGKDGIQFGLNVFKK